MVSITQRLKGVLRQRASVGVAVDFPLRLRPGGATARIALSNRSIAEDAEDPAVVGTLSVANGSGSYTFSIAADPDGKFAIDGDDLVTDAPLDYETATSHSVTIEADNGVDTPITRSFTINVTNVLEQPVNTTEPVVTGQLDGILTCSPGTWLSPDADGATITYQWKDADDDSDLDGETNNALDSQGYIGLSVYCLVYCTNDAGSGFVSSNTVGPLEEAEDVIAPSISSLSPVDNATGVGISVNLVATFDESIQFGASVAIELRLVSDDSVIEAWDETDIDAGISIAGAALTINPSSALDYSEGYYVHIASGSIEDLAANVFAGLTTTDWNFTTQAAPAGASPTYYYLGF